MDSSIGEEGARMEPEISEIELDRAYEEKETHKTIKCNKVEPECCEAAYQDPTTSVAITKTWSMFVGSSTLHGLQYVFTSRTLVRRIIWALFLVAAILWFSFQSSKLLRKYFSYPATTKVSLVYEGSPEFPAVSICNFNRYKKSVIMAKGYDQLLSQYERKLFGLNTAKNYSIDFGEHSDFNISELDWLAGHHINDTLQGCVWSGTICDYRNFTPVLTSMGLCFTFNSGKDGMSILKVKQAGSAFGLQVTLNVHGLEYYGVTSTQTGFKILIHDQETPPMVSQLGFAVGPGTSTFAAIRKQRVLNLAKPYESNCFNETASNVPGYSKYTISSCMLICQTKFVVEKCGCREVGMPDLNNTKVCDLNEAADCLVKEINNFYVLKDYQCDCPVPCDSITFKPALSYAAFPSSSLVSSVVENLYPANAQIITPEVIKGAEEYMSQNNVQLHIYFQELNYQLIQEIPAYDSESLLAEIGGQVGLCVGASLLTVLEFIDVIFSMITIRLGFRGEFART